MTSCLPPALARRASRIVPLLLAGVCSFATAAVPEVLADCHGIADATQRLACYDRLTGRDTRDTMPPEAAARRTPDASMNEQVAHARSTSPAPAAAKPSMIETAWGFDPDSPRYDIRFYNPNYLLIGRYTDNVNKAPFEALAAAAGEDLDLNSTEAKFQLSFKARLFTTDDRRFGVWAAYTQQNQWQVYNGNLSRPFRETNYMPELFVSYGPKLDLGAGFRWSVLNAGYNHQSNGRTDSLSRSWDRLYAEAGIENGNLALFGKLWWRIPEKDEEDDNPDITDYYGHGSLSALYRWKGNSFLATARGNVSTGKGAFEFGWTSPPILGPLRGYVQVFTGYGESLIDYNWKQTTIGAGVALSDGL